MKFGNPRVLNQALTDLQIYPEAGVPIPIMDSVQPVIMVASSTPTIGNVGIARTDIITRTEIKKSTYQTAVANTLYTLHTVTAGKVLYVTNMAIGGDTGVFTRIGDNISGNAVTSGTVYTDSVVVDTGTHNTVAISFNPPLRIATALKFETGGGANICVSINGWEE